MTDNTKPSRAELRTRIAELEQQLTAAESGYSRRSVIKAAAGIAAAGAMGIYATGGVTAAPSGTFPASTDDPLLKIRADRVRLVPRTTDPTADDGTEIYRSDL